MKDLNIGNIDMSKLGAQLEQFQNKWVAVSEQNTIAGSGQTYEEAVRAVHNGTPVVLIKIPPLNVSLAP